MHLQPQPEHDTAVLDDDGAGQGHAAASAPRAAARLLEYQRGRFVAFGAHSTLELIDQLKPVSVPGAPYYCRGLIAWQGRQLPLLDLHTLLRAYPDDYAPPLRHVLVLAFQRAPRAPLEYGALCAPSLLQMIDVADDQQCDLPTDSDLWPWISMACFEHQGQPVPVLDAARLFSQPHV